MAISIPTVVGDYLDSVVASLSEGSPLNNPTTARAASQNYLRSQDSVNILELLQGLLSQPSVLTVVSGTTTTVEDGAATFVANSYDDSYVVFASNTTTAALRGVSRRIRSNSATTLTLVSALPASPVIGDTYTIVAGQVEDFITAIRNGSSGNPYGDRRTVIAAFQKLISQLGGSFPARATNDRLLVHPAGQPGDNLYFASVIDAARESVAAFTLPT